MKLQTDVEKMRRILEKKEMSTKELITLWTDVFPTIVIWSDEEIVQQLTELYDFNEEETSILMKKYRTQIQKKVSPLKEMTSLPDLDKIDPASHLVINTSWESYQLVKKAGQVLNDSEVARYFYESNVNGPKNFYKATVEKDTIYEKLQEVEKLMVNRLQNFLPDEEEKN